MNRENLRQAAGEHLAILEGLAERNPEKSADAMRRHLTEWQAIFVRHLQGSRV
jgi:DNA-binding GntR family transcriptional regulator